MTGLKIKRVLATILLALTMIFTLSSCDIFYSDIPREFYPSRDKLVAHYLDVGQGDSIFIELPNDETMLIDSGENYHGASIIEYMSDCGHDRIDYLIATHPHSDHIGSMAYIVRNFDIGSVYMPNVPTNSYSYEKLLEAVKKKGLLKTINADMSADVLKVGHHGSDTSTPQTLVDAVDPKIAVISVGEGNDYGHPNPKTLKRLEEHGCEIYRTDEQQTIAVISDGYGYEVQTGYRSMERE